MPPLPIIADTFRVSLEWVHTDGQTAANVMHFQGVGKTSADVYAALDTNVAAQLWNIVSGDAKVGEVRVTKLDGGSATYVATPTGAKWAGPGGTGGDTVPQVAAVISLRTALRGRSHRGRIFMPFPVESAIANGRITASITTNVTAWNTFIVAMNTAAVPLVVASYKLGSKELVTSVLLETVLGTQRRRQTRLR